MNKYYVIYLDADGNEETTCVLAPNETLVHKVMRPFHVEQIVLIDDPAFDWDALQQQLDDEYPQ